jgi:hypothetical protein
VSGEAPKARWLTTVEMAAYLRQSPRTLESWRVEGTGPKYFKVGPGKRAKVVYRIDDAEAWISRFGYTSTSEYGVEKPQGPEKCDP